MTRHEGRISYALCNYRDEHEHRCRAFIVPEPQRDPVAPGAIFADYLDVTQAAEAAGWDTGPYGDFCLLHKDLAAEARAASEAALAALTANLRGGRSVPADDTPRGD